MIDKAEEFHAILENACTFARDHRIPISITAQLPDGLFLFNYCPCDLRCVDPRTAAASLLNNGIRDHTERHASPNQNADETTA